MTTITLALDAKGQVVNALTAPRQAPYVCLGCGAPMHVRRGDERAAHFAHDHEGGGCGGESVTHRAAKHLLRQQLEAEITEHAVIRWGQRCAGVTGSCRLQVVLPVDFAVRSPVVVREEVTYGRYRFDVAVTDSTGVVFGFEVYHRHLVPEQKAADLNVPWLELVAEDILEFKPRVPYRGGKSERRCPECEAAVQAARDREQRDQARAAQTSRYVVEVAQVHSAWKGIIQAARKADERQRQRRRPR